MYLCVQSLLLVVARTIIQGARMTTTTQTSPVTGTWTLDPAHTRLGFAARHAMVTTVRGSFTDVSGVLTLDADNPTQSSARVTVQAASFDSGSSDRDRHVRSADFLDVDNYPTLTFVSTSVRPVGDDEYVLAGKLTIKDVTRDIEIAIRLLGTETDPFGNLRAGFEGSAQISRRDFGLTWNVALESGGVLVSDKVRITLDVSAIRTADEMGAAVNPAA
jgi:polyisoprenoid-binding protein YceI